MNQSDEGQEQKEETEISVKDIEKGEEIRIDGYPGSYQVLDGHKKRRQREVCGSAPTGMGTARAQYPVDKWTHVRRNGVWVPISH